MDKKVLVLIACFLIVLSIVLWNDNPTENKKSNLEDNIIVEKETSEKIYLYYELGANDGKVYTQEEKGVFEEVKLYANN